MFSYKNHPLVNKLELTCKYVSKVLRAGQLGTLTKYTGIQLEVKSNIGPLFDSKERPNIKFFSNIKTRLSYSPKFGSHQLGAHQLKGLCRVVCG